MRMHGSTCKKVYDNIKFFLGEKKRKRKELSENLKRL